MIRAATPPRPGDRPPPEPRTPVCSRMVAYSLHDRVPSPSRRIPTVGPVLRVVASRGDELVNLEST